MKATPALRRGDCWTVVLAATGIEEGEVMGRMIFERMVETAELIARHPDYPGKQAVVRQCLEEVQDLRDSGRISLCQCERLQVILEGVAVTN